jgi:hypothetical protein
MGSRKGGAEMNPEIIQAATEAAARVALPKQLYRICSEKSIVINEILARLVFSLESPHTTVPKRQTVLSTIDDLIRLKTDAGLLTEVQHGR